MSKMGISTIQSYRGAQIFEAIGLGAELHRQVLHVHGVAHRRHRASTRSRSDIAVAPQAGVPGPRRRPRRAGLGRPVPVAARRRVPPLQPGDCFPPAARDAHRAVRHLQASTRAWSTSRASDSAPCAAYSSSSPTASRSRSRKSSRRRRSVPALRDGRDVVMARSARRRTRRWRSR